MTKKHFTFTDCPYCGINYNTEIDHQCLPVHMREHALKQQAEIVELRRELREKTPAIVIELSGGIVQDTFGTARVDLTVIDYDVQGPMEDDHRMVNDRQAWVYEVPATTQAGRYKATMEEIDEQDEACLAEEDV